MTFARRIDLAFAVMTSSALVWFYEFSAIAVAAVFSTKLATVARKLQLLS